MNLPTILTFALGFTATYKYPLIFFGAFIEGPILMIASGFLLRHGVLLLFPLFIALVLGDLLGDVLWYCIGYFFLQPLMIKKGKFFGVTPEIFQRVKKLFDKYHEKILIVSKLTLGFGLAVGVLMIAGATRVPFKKYMLINFCCELLLVAMLLSLGYFFGNIYANIQDASKTYFLLIVGSGILLAIYGLSKFLKRIIYQL